MSAFFAILLSLLAIFLILLVLVQRGRGGGLAGALGGMGGSSAFGAKAGDIFTRITIITASIWIVCCLISLFWAENRNDALGSGRASTTNKTSDMVPPSAQSPSADKTGAEKATSGPEIPATTTPGAPADATVAPATSTAPAASTATPDAPTTPPAVTTPPATESTPPAAAAPATEEPKGESK